MRRVDGSPVRLRVENFERLCSALDLHTAQQRVTALGVSSAQYYKILAGAPAGPKWIDCCLRLFGGRYYEQLFELLDPATVAGMAGVEVA